MSRFSLLALHILLGWVFWLNTSYADPVMDEKIKSAITVDAILYNGGVSTLLIDKKSFLVVTGVSYITSSSPRAALNATRSAMLRANENFSRFVHGEQIKTNETLSDNSQHSLLESTQQSLSTGYIPPISTIDNWLIEKDKRTFHVLYFPVNN